MSSEPNAGDARTTAEVPTGKESDDPDTCWRVRCPSCGRTRTYREREDAISHQRNRPCTDCNRGVGVAPTRVATDGGTDLEPLSPEEGVERFLAMRRDSGNRESTYNNDVTRMNHFLRWCREEEEIENLNTLTGRQLSGFVSWRCEQVAKTTVEKQLSAIREALRFWANIEAVEPGLAERIYAPQLKDVDDARGVHLEPERAEHILGTLDRFHYASRRHVVMALLWRTGMRRSALRSLDVDDLKEDDHAVRLEHRIDEGTRLKNGDDGSRWVFLGPRWFQIVEDYLANPARPDKTDDHGRRPLLTTSHGRPTGDTIYTWVNKATHPCEYGECPHDRDPDDCEARGTDGYASKCPSARSPHAVRRGAITDHLNKGTTPEVVSERMDVGLQTLYKHYDARNERDKMTVRKDALPE